MEVGVMGGLGDDLPSAPNDLPDELDVMSVDGSVAPVIDAMGARSVDCGRGMVMPTTLKMLETAEGLPSLPNIPGRRGKSADTLPRTPPSFPVFLPPSSTLLTILVPPSPPLL